MENGNAVSFFLGANTRYGFRSFYDGFADLDGGDFLWVIKGGPGCGKSSFMKRLGAAAQARGVPVEYILCSGDPDSLDGVRFPTLRTAYVDGTAPHVIEAKYPGSASLYLDLGAFYNAGALEDRHSDIARLNARYKDMYKNAYACLSAAGQVRRLGAGELFGERQREIIERRAAGIARREMRPSGGTVSVRLISAVTCRGYMTLSGTVSDICARVVTVDNDLGFAGKYLEALSDAARGRGERQILCPDPLDPDELQAVLLPERSLGFIAVSRSEPYDGDVSRRVRLDAIADREQLEKTRRDLRRSRRLYDELMLRAAEQLSAAKGLHDELEGIYNPCVDFEGLYAAAQEHISWLFP